MKKLFFLIALSVMSLYAFDQPKVIRTKAFKVEIYGKGRPMILIPGLACSGEVWQAWVSRYQSEYECHVLTLGGFAGEASGETPFLEKVRLNLSEYIASQQLQNPIIVGHSLGGFLALSLAASEPEKAGSLIIVDAVPFVGALQDPSATAESLAPQAEMLRGMIVKQSKDQYTRQQAKVLASMISDTANIRRVLQWGLASDFKMIGQAMYEMMTTDLRDAMVRIEAPTIVLGSWIAMKPYGLNSEQVKVNYLQQYQYLKGVSVTMAPAAKHFIMLDDPQWLFAQVDAFLSQRSTAEGKK
ncbi:alpha/beta hydrolase [bacterium]|nr:alpha/beta hydrolase [bacterium]